MKSDSWKHWSMFIQTSRITQPCSSDKHVVDFSCNAIVVLLLYTPRYFTVTCYDFPHFPISSTTAVTGNSTIVTFFGVTSYWRMRDKFRGTQHKHPQESRFLANVDDVLNCRFAVHCQAFFAARGLWSMSVSWGGHKKCLASDIPHSKKIMCAYNSKGFVCVQGKLLQDQRGKLEAGVCQ